MCLGNTTLTTRDDSPLRSGHLIQESTLTPCYILECLGNERLTEEFHFFFLQLVCKAQGASHPTLKPSVSQTDICEGLILSAVRMEPEGGIFPRPHKKITWSCMQGMSALHDLNATSCRMISLLQTPFLLHKGLLWGSLS